MTDVIQRNNSDEEIFSSVTVTDAAAQKIKELIDEEGDADLNLRVYITGGGCSGFKYGFTFDKAINPDDIIIEKSVTSKETA